MKKPIEAELPAFFGWIRKWEMAGGPSWLVPTLAAGVFSITVAGAQPSLSAVDSPKTIANPKVRHEVVVQIPSKLALKRTGDSISIAQENTVFQSKKLSVGLNMIIGVHYRVYVYPSGDPRPSQTQSGGTGTGTNFIDGMGDFGVPGKRDRAAIKGKKSIVEIVWTVFETDMEPQHFWEPESGKYKILLTGTLRQEVD